jgi:hypothetical protein
MPSVPKASVLLRPFIASDVLFAFANLNWKGGVATGHGVVVSLLQDVVDLLRDVGRILRDLAGILPDVGDLRDPGVREQCLLSKVVHLVNEELVLDVGRLYRGSGGAVCTRDGRGQGRAVFPERLVRKVPQNLPLLAFLRDKRLLSCLSLLMSRETSFRRSRYLLPVAESPFLIASNVSRVS